MEKDSFKTLRGRGQAEIIEKRSRFIALAAAVDNEEAALAELNAVREAHKTASHHVYAWVLGTGGEHPRQSDDGEPAGTAGAPVLAALRNMGLTNAMVIVTRYFGGTLLGTGGLTRAYGQAAREALNAAGAAELALHNEYTVQAAYSLLGKLQREYGARGYNIASVNYAAEVELSVLVRCASADDFLRLTADLTNGAAHVIFLSTKYSFI